MSLNTRFQTYGRNWKHKGLTGRKSCNSNQYARGLYSPDKNLAMLMLMLIIIDPCNYNLQNLQKVCEEWQFAKYSKNNPRCPNVLFRYCIVYFVFRSFPSLTNVTCALPYTLLDLHFWSTRILPYFILSQLFSIIWRFRPWNHTFSECISSRLIILRDGRRY